MNHEPADITNSDNAMNNDDVQAGTFSVVDAQEVTNAIGKLSKKKASKLDGVCIESISNAHPVLLHIMSKLYTSMLTHGFIPESLMKTVITPIVKSQNKSKSDVNNYRPIAVASTFLKILESIIKDRLVNQLQVSDHQFGYKKQLSTESCAFTLKSVLHKYVNRNSKMYVCFLDASKAFDLVNHNSLFRILESRGVSANILRIVKYLYKFQKCQVSWDGETSDDFVSTRGVKQGGILSPSFFNVYMHELSERLDSIRTGCIVGSKLVNHLLYADDLVIFSPTAEGLRKLLRVCDSFAENFNLVFNSAKSVCMALTKNKFLANIPVPNMYLQGNVLSTVNRVKYLGYIITSDLSDDADIEERVRWIYSVANILKRKFSNCKTVVKSKLFSSYFNQFYGLTLWAQASTRTLQSIKVAYNDAFRIFFDVKRGESVSLNMVRHNVRTLQEMRRICIYRSLERFKRSPNVLVQTCMGEEYSSLLSRILYR